MSLSKLTLLILGVSFFVSTPLAAQVAHTLEITTDGSYILNINLEDNGNATDDAIALDSLLKVYVGERIEGQPAIIGQYQKRNNVLLFQPKFGFQQGVKYVGKVGDDVFQFTIPKKVVSSTKVTHIYPSSEALPANQLKFYLFFSAPMGEANFYKHVQLFNAKGDTIPEAFVELMPALWSEDRRRLTLWVNPGRIKRKLGPNESLGSPLLPNQTYTLRIASAMRNSKGNALASSFTKTFKALPEDRQKPDISRWKIELPEPGTTSPITIRFGEAMDFTLLQEAIAIVNAAGEVMEGDIEILANETGLLFTPKLPWKMGKHTLRVAAKLEDLAGNNLNRLFDTDLKTQRRRKGEEYYELELKF